MEEGWVGLDRCVVPGALDACAAGVVRRCDLLGRLVCVVAVLTCLACIACFAWGLWRSGRVAAHGLVGLGCGYVVVVVCCVVGMDVYREADSWFGKCVCYMIRRINSVSL